MRKALKLLAGMVVFAALWAGGLSNAHAQSDLVLLERYATADASGQFALSAAAAEQILASRSNIWPQEDLTQFKLAAARAHLRSNNRLRAAQLIEQAIVELEERLGANAPDVAAAYEELSEVLAVIGDIEDASKAFNKALVIYRSLYGATHPSYRFALSRGASLHARLGLFEQSAKLAEQALKLERAAKDPKLLERLASKKRDLKNEAFAIVDVFYGTNRKPSGKGGLDNFYGNDTAPLSLGIVKVSVPTQNRRFGELKSPSLLRFEFRPDPAKHVMLWDITPLDASPFYAKLSQTIASSKRKEAMVFIHGFKNSFDNAARRAALLAYDLDVDGAPIVYSWPSGNTLLSYVADAKAVNDRTNLAEFERFLEDILARSGAEKIQVIAHSMGNQFFSNAFTQMIENREAKGETPRPLFDQLLFAAPDVDRTTFAKFVGRIGNWANRKTLYASTSDLALEISQRINSFPRAGDANPPLIVDGLDTIDATFASTGGLGHTYFASGALNDVQAMMWLNLSPDRRCVLQKANAAAKAYWRFGTTTCQNLAFQLAVLNLRRFGPKAALAQAKQKQAEAKAANNTADANLWANVTTQIEGISK